MAWRPLIYRRNIQGLPTFVPAAFNDISHGGQQMRTDCLRFVGEKESRDVPRPLPLPEGYSINPWFGDSSENNNNRFRVRADPCHRRRIPHSGSQVVALPFRTSNLSQDLSSWTSTVVPTRRRRPPSGPFVDCTCIPTRRSSRACLRTSARRSDGEF